jgi:hypothetical protein
MDKLLSITLGQFIERKFCKLLSHAVAHPNQFVQALFENRSRGLVKRAICESAQFSPLATTEVERVGYLIYCIINQPEVLPSSLKLTIDYPYSYKSMKERAYKYLASPASIHAPYRIPVVFHSNGMVTVGNCLWEWGKIKKFLMRLQRHHLDMRV